MYSATVGRVRPRSPASSKDAARQLGVVTGMVTLPAEICPGEVSEFCFNEHAILERLLASSNQRWLQRLALLPRAPLHPHGHEERLVYQRRS